MNISKRRAIAARSAPVIQADPPVAMLLSLVGSVLMALADLGVLIKLFPEPQLRIEIYKFVFSLMCL